MCANLKTTRRNSLHNLKTKQGSVMLVDFLIHLYRLLFAQFAVVYGGEGALDRQNV